MNIDIFQQRLSNQQLAGNPLDSAEAVVSHLVAVQAQDYFGSKWAVGQRLQEADETAVKAAFNDGRILRTHLMRPTWHYVTPTDILWIQELTAPRVNIVNRYMYRQLELDEPLFARTNHLIGQSLVGRQYKTRAELGDLLTQAGIPAAGMRLGYILMRAETDALICSGPRRGKQFTYALVSERAPHAKKLAPDEALAELTRRYFTGHGPAAVEDFAFWSGLTKTQARQGLEMNKDHLVQETIEGRSCWLAPDLPLVTQPSPTSHLLPNYDEYLISYRQGNPFRDPSHAALIETQNAFFAHFLIIDGRILGTWRRDFEKNTVILTLRRFTPLTNAEEAAVRQAGAAFGRFLGLDVAYQSAPF